MPCRAAGNARDERRVRRARQSWEDTQRPLAHTSVAHEPPQRRNLQVIGILRRDVVASQAIDGDEDDVTRGGSLRVPDREHRSECRRDNQRASHRPGA